MNNQISIIIPTYNRAHLINETLDSIKLQEFKLWECLVIDDGSTDSTQSIVEEYAILDPRFKYFKRPSNLKKGAPSCRNFGFEKASGQYIQWFDSDDIMLPNMLQRKYDELVNKDYDFVVSKMGKFDQNSPHTFPDYPIWSERLVDDYLLYKIYFLTPGPLFNRKYLEKQKLLFDENLIKHQEWEFYSRLVLTGGRGFAMNEFHCVRRMHDESIKSLTDNLSSQVKNENKFNAILALDKNTNYQFNKKLVKLFYKRISKVLAKNLLEFNFKYAFRFASVLIKLVGVKRTTTATSLF
jgi:glycosyltransferase involved in cell wall biosynthesis